MITICRVARPDDLSGPEVEFRPPVLSSLFVPRDDTSGDDNDASKPITVNSNADKDLIWISRHTAATLVGCLYWKSIYVNLL